MLLLLLPLFLSGCVGAPDPVKLAAVNEIVIEKEGITALKVGDPAPMFTANTADGERVVVGMIESDSVLTSASPDLDSGTAGAPEESDEPAPDTGGEYTVLYFYPADFTPNATKHFRDFTKGVDKLGAAQVKVYGISRGSREEHIEFAKEYGIAVPLLVDTGAVAQLYGTMLDGGKFPQRTLVGIKPDGTIGFYDRAMPLGSLTDTLLKKTGREPVKE